MLGRSDGQLEWAGHLFPAQPADCRVPRDEVEIREGSAIIEQKALWVEKRMCVQGDGHKGYANQTNQGGIFGVQIQVGEKLDGEEVEIQLGVGGGIEG